MKGTFYYGGLAKVHMILASMACLGLSDSAHFGRGVALKGTALLKGMAARPTREFTNLFEAFGL